MSTKREAAHVAACRGLNVFPIAPNAKTPLIANWQNLATQDSKQIDTWWNEWPDANIACTTETLIVVDIDPRNGAEATMQALLAVEEFPKTVRNATQGGGTHLIYAAPRPVKGGTNKLGKGVDIKARGGYILLPGSTIDGRSYEWENKAPIAPAPQWIVDQCNASKPKADAAGKRIVEEDDTAIELATKWMLERAPTAEYGEIDDTTYKVAARLYDFGVTVATATEILLEWNDLKCSPPGDIERLYVVVESASRSRENAIGSRHPEAGGFEATDIDESRAPVVGIPTSKPKDTLHAENFFAAADLALTDLSEPLITGILDRAAMSILYGESNTGKTFIAIDIAFHVAVAMTWAGRAVRQGCVVYVAAEGGRGVYKRLAALRKTHPGLAVVPLYVVKFPVDLLHGPEHARELVRICREVAEASGLALEMIVIDTLSRAMSGGDENSSTDMGLMVKAFDAIREATGAHLMVIHHSGKDRAKGARGHSLLRAATDTEIEVERGKITVTKQRDMDGEFKQHFKLKPVNIGVGKDGNPVASCVVEFIAASAAGPVEVPATEDERQLAVQLRDRLKRTGETTFGAQFVRETYLELAWSRGESDPAIYKVLQTLQAKGLVQKLKPGQYVMEITPKLQTTPN